MALARGAVVSAPVTIGVAGDGAGSFVVVHPDDLPKLYLSLARALVRRADAPVEVRIWKEPAGWTPTELTVAPLHSDEPFPFGFAPMVGASLADVAIEHRLADVEYRLWKLTAQPRPASPIRPGGERQNAAGADRQRPFSLRQREILELLLAGRRVPTIAKQLGISTSTVRNHLSQVFRRFSVHSQAELLEAFRHPDAGPRPSP